MTASPLEQIVDLIEPLSNLFVSVIVPVFNDAIGLKKCLEMLEQQTYPQPYYEVIVVDNGSDQADEIQGIVAQFNQAIAAVELTPGSYAARNKGISLARGDVLAFTDADCIPALDWIEQGVSSLLHCSNCGLVAGSIKLFFHSPDRLTPVEQYERMKAFSQERYLQQYKGCATANLFTRRSTIETVGLFNQSLKSGGDFEWGRRVFLHGYGQVYSATTWVAHPARSSLTELQRKVKRVAGGVYDLYVAQEPLLLSRNKAFLRLLFDDLLATFKQLINVLINPKNGTFWQRASVSYVVLFVCYVSISEKTVLRLGGASARS